MAEGFLRDDFIRWPSDESPHSWRWMVFVDGENFTTRGQQILADKGLRPPPDDPYFKRDVFLWARISGVVHSTSFLGGAMDANLRFYPVRAYYYASTTGGDEEQKKVRRALSDLGFSPEVFRREKSSNRSKGVDIALAKDMLGHAALDNYDVAVLVAGDGDYLPLVKELRRLGKRVYVAFFDGKDQGLNPELRLESDMFIRLNDFLLKGWQGLAQPAAPEELDVRLKSQRKIAAALRDLWHRFPSEREFLVAELKALAGEADAVD